MQTYLVELIYDLDEQVSVYIDAYSEAEAVSISETMHERTSSRMINPLLKLWRDVTIKIQEADFVLKIYLSVKRKLKSSHRLRYFVGSYWIIDEKCLILSHVLRR